MMQVYVIGGGPGAVKVGMSSDLAKRLASIQNGNPFQLVIAGATDMPSSAAARATEAKAHWLLRDCRLKGEWFSCSAQAALDAVQQAMLDPSIPDAPVPQRPLKRRNTMTAACPPLQSLRERQVQHRVTDLAISRETQINPSTLYRWWSGKTIPNIADFRRVKEAIDRIIARKS